MKGPVHAALGFAAAVFALHAAAQSDTRGHAGAAFGKAKSPVACPAGGSCDDDTSAWKLFVGGRVDENFGGEISFVQTQDFARTGGELNMRALNLSALAGIPLGKKAWLFGKAGLLRGHTEIGAGNGDGWGASFGVGAMIDVSRRLALRVDWDRYRVKLPPGGEDHASLDFLTVGAQYVFGK